MGRCGVEKIMNKLSFIIPVYNCEQYLKECINGISKMNLSDYEIILVDDGSTDDSGFVCDFLESHYEKIKCVHQKNLGVSAARNKGIEISTGDYVIFIDSDDNIEPDKFKSIVEVIENDASIDMAIFGLSFDYYYRGKCYRRVGLIPPLSGKIQSVEWVKKIEELYDTNALSPVWNKVIKKSILVDSDLRLREDMFLYEDLEFSLRCLAYCDAIYFSQDIIYHYRQSEDEGNTRRRLKKIPHISDLVEQIEAAADELFVYKHTEHGAKLKNSILLKLYLALAREKISVLNRDGIRQICDDFSMWMKPRVNFWPEKNGQFMSKLLNRQIDYFMWKKKYVQIRHRIAVWVKYKKAMVIKCDKTEGN